MKNKYRILILVDIILVVVLIYTFHSEISSFIMSHIYPLIVKDFKCIDCNVILIVIDSARQDHFGIYGYYRNTTPNIDKLAEKSFVFENAISQATWTEPSISSLFSSEYPSRLEYANKNKKSQYITLAKEFSLRGYYTYGMSGNGLINKESNFDEGFELFFNYWFTPYHGLYNITSKATHLLNQLESGEKFFMYLHYHQPHAPYMPPKPFNVTFLQKNFKPIDTSSKRKGDYKKKEISNSQIEYMVSQYDGNLAAVDFELNKIFTRLKNKGLMDKTIVIITADHGEELFDHDEELFHGPDAIPYDTVIKVPLIIWLPEHEKDNVRVVKQVRLLDLVPTLLEITGYEPPKGLRGISLTPFFKEEGPDLVAFSESGLLEDRIIVVRTNDLKYIYFLKDGREKLFDLRVDPYEKNELRGNEDLKQRFRKELLDYYERNNPLWNEVRDKEFVELDNETIKRLRELGYLT